MIYPSPAAAAAALASHDAAERGTQAFELPTVTGVGDQVSAWEEPAPGDSGGAIVRVTWQSREVIAQVSVLGQPGVALEDATVQLATAQQASIRTAQPAP